MSVSYVDSGCSVAGNVAATFNISSTNDQVSIVVDGGSTQTFTLTHGATQTAANVVSDLAGLSGATADDVNVNGTHYVRITDATSNGVTSTIQVLAPSNNANSTLGFVATTYTGGQRVNSVFIGDTKANLANGLEAALNSAGWVTVSNHQTPTASSPGVGGIVLQSAMSPSTDNLRMRLHIKDNGNNNIVLSAENVGATKSGANSTSAGGQLRPLTGQQWRVIANKYQCFVFRPDSMFNSESFCGFGIPALPSFLSSGTVYEAIWLNCNAQSDTDGTIRGSFRTVCGGWGGFQGANNGAGNSQFICNGNIWEINSSNTGSGGIGTFSLNVMSPTISTMTTSWYRWADTSTLMADPILMWGLTSASAEAQGRGFVWDCFVDSDAFPCDITISSIDGHTWWNLTHLMVGNSTNSIDRGSVWIAIA